MAKFKLGVLQFVFFACTTVKGDAPPTFTPNLPEDNIGKTAEGRVATFYCKASGDQPLTYSWIATYLNGNSRDISINRRYTFHADGRLTISNTQHAMDDGFYHCVAKNHIGAVISRQAKLRVAYLTIPTSTGTAVTLRANKYEGFKYTFALTDTFPHHPKTTYDWRKSGVPISESDRISISAAGNLYIGMVEMGDIGSYTSVVRNTVTSTSYTRPSFIINVASSSSLPSRIKSSILLGPSHQVAVNGKNEEVNFECFVAGSPIPATRDLEWRKDGIKVTSSAKFQFHSYNKRLTVKSIMSSDAGLYSCHVTNPKSAGAGSWTGNLTVYVAPSFRSGGVPLGQTRYVDNSVTFQCSVSGIPKPLITWYNNGRKVVPSSRESINSYNDYVIRKIQAQDQGIIQCLASNDGGHIIAAARLTLLGIPVWIDVGPTDRSVTLGETVEFPCQTRGNPQPTVTWSKDRTIIDVSSSNTRFHKKANGALQITNTKRIDSGTYTCTAANNKGSKNASAVLRVLAQTNITTPLPARSTAIKGLSKILVVGVAKDYSVSLRFTWTKDGAAINNQRITVLGNGSLFIVAVHDSDAGTYKCVVSSGVGNASTSTVLVVMETPLSPSRPVVSQIQSISLRLTWNPPGYTGNSRITSYNVEYQIMSNQWLLKLQNINPSSPTVSAMVTGLKPYTRYRFRVRAVNEIGIGLPSDPTPIVNTFSAPPSAAPTNVRGTPASAESILVQWQTPAAHTHNGLLLGYRINYRLNGVHGQAFNLKDISGGQAIQGTVTGLLLWTEYEVKVQAYNSAGAGPFSISIIITTGEGVPAAPVREVRILRITATTVELEWKPPPQKQWNGRLKGYKLLAWEPSNTNTILRTLSGHDSSKSIQRGTLINLKKFTQYEVVVVAYNSAGDSPRSTKMLIKTEEGIPDAVSSFSVSDVYSDGFQVSWGHPAQVNGKLLAYIVKHWRNDSQALTTVTESTKNYSLSMTVTGLNANTWYTVTVAAQTGAGLGSSRKLYVRTVDSPVLPGAPSKPQFMEVRAWSVFLRWTPGPSGRAPIQTYTIQYNNDSYYDSVTAVWRVAMILRNAHKVYRLFPLEVPHLRPYTKYHFRVIATNIVGSSPPSNVSDSARTLEAAPSLPPSNLTVHPRAMKGELEIRWKIPPEDSWNSLYIGYIITFEPASSSQHTTTLQIPNVRVTRYIVGGLLRYTRYKISIRSYNLNGKGATNKTAVAYYVTADGAPDQPPSNVRAIARGPTRIEVSWGPIPEVGRNGKILGYQIFYKVQGQAIEKMKKVESARTFSVVIDGLESFVIYEFHLLGYTRFGPGPRSRPVRAKTAGSVPGPPARVRFPEVTYDWVKLTWDPPIYPHGNITGYRVKYKVNLTSTILQRHDLPRTPRTKVFTNLRPDVYYRFYVYAKTIDGWGPAAEEVVYTTNQRVAPDSPFIFPIPTSAISNRWVLIEWRVNEHPTSPLRYFTLQFEVDNGGWLDYPTSLSAKLRKLKVEGLLPGKRYRFRIMATNDVGNSPYSSPSQEVSTIPTVPTGAPRDVRITTPSSTSLLIEWTAPLPEVLGGTLQGFKLKYREKGSSMYRELNLASDVRHYTITGLKVFTTYYIRLSAVNEKGEGAITPDLPGTTGELAPNEAPSNVDVGKTTMTSVYITWIAPPSESINGLLQGYKVYYEEKRARRRRRSSFSHCQRKPGPQYIDVGHARTSANVTNLRKYVRYRFWVRAYTAKGESPRSATVYATTLPDLPGPTHNFAPEAVYNQRVDLAWDYPCDPNGIMVSFEIAYGKVSATTKATKVVDPSATSAIITGLEKLTQYSFQIRAKNDVGYGPVSTFVSRTKGPAVLPGRPGKPIVSPLVETAEVTWQNGHSGNVPFTEFEIHYKKQREQDFKKGWTFKPEDTSKNKTYVSCTVGNLKPSTSYQFLIYARNEIGISEPSPPSDVATTGSGTSSSRRVWQQTWFIVLLVLFVFILILVIIGFIFIQRRRRKERDMERISTAGSSSTRTTLDQSDNRSNRSNRSRNNVPGLQITYRDPNEEAEVSSIGSKEGVTDDSEDSGVSEDDNYPVKSKPDDSFVSHYVNDPNHRSWRNSLDNEASRHEEKGLEIEDGIPRPRFKSFSSNSLDNEKKIEHGRPPPAYDSHTDHMTSTESLNRIRAQLPPEAVTSFMSPEYEAKKAKPPRPKPHRVKQNDYADDIMRHSPYGSRERVDKRPVHGSQDRFNGKRDPPQGSRERLQSHGSRDQLRQSPHGSRDQLRPSPRGSRDRLDEQDPRKPPGGGFSYGTLPPPQNVNTRGDPRSSSFRQALGDSGGARTLPRNSEESDRSSSSNDYRDTRNLVRGRKGTNAGYPRVEFSEEPGKSRRRPPNLDSLERNKNMRLAPNDRGSRGSSSSGTPSSPVSPAPSYHSASDPFAIKMESLPGRTSPAAGHAGYPEGSYNNPTSRRPVMVIENGFDRNVMLDNSEPQMSSYQSFV